MRAPVPLRLGCHICQPGKLDEAAFYLSTRAAIEKTSARWSLKTCPSLLRWPRLCLSPSVWSLFTFSCPTSTPSWVPPFPLLPMWSAYNLFWLWGAFFDHLNNVSFSLCCISIPASLSSYSTSSRTITLPYTSSHYSIIVEGSANKVDNCIFTWGQLQC